MMRTPYTQSDRKSSQLVHEFDGQLADWRLFQAAFSFEVLSTPHTCRANVDAVICAVGHRTACFAAEMSAAGNEMDRSWL